MVERTYEEEVVTARMASNEDLLNTLRWAGIFQASDKAENRKKGDLVAEVATAELLRRLAR